MKRYLALIGIVVLTIGVIATLFYFLLQQDNSYIMYIKIQADPSFVIGIDEDENVIFYNSLNSSGNKYDLSMFQGKKLTEMINIFIEKLGYASIDKNIINVTVMTKNNDVEKHIMNIISNEIAAFDNNYIVLNHEPNNDDLERYSNEVVYNLKSSLSHDDLKKIGRYIYDKVQSYTEYEIKNYDLSDLTKFQNEQKIEDVILSIDEINEEIVLLDNSFYNVNLAFNEDGSYFYDIVLHLELEKGLSKEEKKIVEVYSFDYQVGEEKEIINNLKIYFYTF